MSRLPVWIACVSPSLFADEAYFSLLDRQTLNRQTLKICFVEIYFELLKQLTIFFQLSLLTVKENN